MSKLRKSARGQQCQVRIPGVCNWNPETTVLAHIRRAGLAGVGQKPPNWAATFACSACHDAMDGRSKTEFNDAYVLQMVFDGHLRTLKWWHDNGYIWTSDDDTPAEKPEDAEQRAARG